MPEMKLNKKFLPLLEKHKPIKVVYGGRDSGKSIGFGDIFTMKMQTEACDIYCLREYQETVLDSVHRVFTKSINDRLKLEGWNVQENKVISPGGNKTVYKGAARNPDNIQSAEGYKYSWFEEAHRASQASLDKLLPTIIRNPDAECWFSANPQGAGDPFSLRFIIPFLHELNTNGYYEDDLHMIIKVNWRDNPWYGNDTEKLRKWDYENLSRAKYDWIWEGSFYDGVENPLILAEWFDACIDAHVKLGFEPKGIRFASHDPSDEGPDSKGYAFRHGSVVLDVQEKTDGNITDGCNWATGLAIQHNADAFTWDCDGMGVGLNFQVAQAFKGHNTILSQYKGSKGVDNPVAIFQPAFDSGIQGQKTVKESVKNRRAQYYLDLRDKMYRTWEAVEKKVYHDPDTLISLSSNINCLQSLRSELCSMPIKPNGNGLVDLYTKEEMKTKFKVKSPNLADSVKMLGRVPHINKIPTSHRPPPIRVMGIGANGRM